MGSASRKLHTLGIEQGNSLDWIYQFQAILQQPWVQLAEKFPPPSQTVENDLDRIYPFQAISSNCWDQLAEKLPPRELKQANFFRLDLSISGNFQINFRVQLAEKALQELNKEFFYMGFINFR